MTPRLRPSRRRVIAGAVTLASIAAADPLLCSAESGSAQSGPAALAALCAELARSDAIGRSCLGAVPAPDATAPRLARLLLDPLAAEHRDCSSAAALHRALRAHSRADFAAGRTAMVDGWMLSRTETRLYALAALLAQKPMPLSARS